MITSTEYLLERLAHHVLAGTPRQASAMVREALAAGAPAAGLIADVVFPAIECLQQLNYERALAARTVNMAARSLTGVLHELEGIAPRAASVGRSMLLVAGPGHGDELGASAVAALAEIHGFAVMFAGAGVSVEEIAFAAGQLAPDILMMHAGLPAEREATARVVRRWQEIGLWPRAQVAVTGAAVEEGTAASLGADVAGSAPLAVLELLALCPEHRGRRAGRVMLSRFHVN
ncbi:MAG TPA: cobalamin-dependent protein [Phycisphaerae bacterium]|jgi:methanogenic corrinoid protein MtbC1|nr:cobalamin-dependent protein [Phycisphaerae bacterium]